MGVSEENNDEALLQTDRVMCNYVSSTLKNQLIFSKLREDKAFRAILGWLRDKDITPVVHPNKWELVYTKTQELEDPEDEDEDQSQPQSFKVKVELLKVPDNKGKIVVQFTRLGGSAWLFYDHVTMLKD